MGQAYTVPYCATKGAVVNMTRALAMEFVKQPIRINAIAPGGINTPLVHNFEIQADVDYDLMKPYMGFRPASTGFGSGSTTTCARPGRPTNVNSGCGSRPGRSGRPQWSTKAWTRMMALCPQ